MLNKSLNFIKKIKRNFFPFYKNKELRFVFNKIQEGYPENIVTARFVGGCVRKYLKNDIIDDIDIATMLSTEEIKRKFENSKFKVVETGIKHGTVTLVSEKFNLEITTLRKDVETDGRHAEVEYIDDWQLDSERRDFTINAIYLDINGKLFDPQMGSIDLQNNNVKFIGDPQKRIEEDYLRIIRFLRFAIQYDSNTDDNTIKALKLNLNGIQKISKERILGELIKILELKNFENILKHHNKKLIFSLIFPELKFLNRLQKLKSIYKYSSINRDILLATLLIDEKENYEYFCHKYKVSNEIKDKLKLISKNLKLLRENKNFFDSDLEKNIYLNGKNHLISINILNYTINDKYKLSSFSKNLKKILKSKVHKFPIDGDYLIAKGMSEGLALGKVLKKVENEWINNNFKVSEEKIQSIIKQNSN